MFKNPFSFKGRIRRLEYGISFIISIIGLIISVKYFSEDYYLIFQSSLRFFFLYIIIMQGVKRCHDLGLNGFYQLIPLSHIILVFKDGQIGLNKYGPNPKGINSSLKIKKKTYFNLMINNIDIWLSKLNKEQKTFYSIIIPTIIFFMFFILAYSITSSKYAEGHPFKLHHTWWIWMIYTFILSIIVYFFYGRKTK